jgi:drug/metabolite transporter (DMT)-like permease
MAWNEKTKKAFYAIICIFLLLGNSYIPRRSNNSAAFISQRKKKIYRYSAMGFESLLSVRKYPFIGALAIMSAAFLWGVDGVVLRPSLYSLDVAVVVFLEHFIAFLFMAPLMWNARKELPRLHHSGVLAFVWIALFGGAIGTMAITQALFLVDFIPLSVPILIQKLQPLFAIIFAVFMLKEKPSKKFYAYAALALVGSYLVTFGFEQPVVSLENKTLVAALLGLLAAFSWGSCTTVGRFAVSKVSSNMATYLRFGLTSLIMMLLILGLGKIGGFAAIGPGHLLTLLIIVFSSGGVAMMMYYYGLKSVPASKATIFELVFPLTAIMLDFVLHGKMLSIGQLFGAAILMYSVVLIQRVEIGSPGAAAV